ncbi:MAG: acyl carrier protein [Bacteroidota bacterium]
MEDRMIIEKLKELLSHYVVDKTALADVSMEDHLSHDLHIDSFNIVEIVLDVEEYFGVIMDDEAISQMETFGNCFNILKKSLATS